MKVPLDGQRRIQQAIDFLSTMERGHLDQPGPVMDYEAILALANRGGFDFDETDLRQAFALLMRARVISLR